MNKPIEAGSGKRKKQKKVLGYTKNSTFYSLKDYITSDIASGYNAYDTQEVRLSQIRKLLYNHGLSKNKNFQGMKPGLERRYPGLVRIDELAKNLFWEGFSYSTYDAKCEMNRFCIDDIPEFFKEY